MAYSKKLSFFIVLFIWLLAGCSPKTVDVTSPVSEMESFSSEGAFEVPDRWWTTFDDPELNQVMDSALANNLDLKSAWYRLQEARAIRDRESATFFPTLDASADVSTQQPESTQGGGEEWDVGLSAGYEVDLWGRIRASMDAEEFRMDASYYDYQTAALSLSAEIVRVWYGLAEARRQVEIAEEQVETNASVLDLIKTRFGNGQVRRVDILRQEQLLESSRERLIQAESRQQVLEHQLAVLLGNPPREEISPMPRQLPELSSRPGTGLPTELIQRRPDVRQALNNVRASDRDLAAAISNQYPRLTLSASLSSSAGNTDDLFNNWIRSFAGNLFAPVFYGGELRAEAERLDAVKNQSLYAYGQTVLTAFQEVEDALIREQKQKKRIESLEKQLELARETNEQIRVAYFNGMGNYLDVLTALDEAQQLERNLLSERLVLFEYRIALFRALAGGFETTPVDDGTGESEPGNENE
ncbi:MAG: efflux transporter outer membrane subunit [Bacteroidota bacterium]